MPHLTTAEAITLGVGNLMCSMDRVYELAKEFTGDDLFTHQLIRFGNEAGARLQDELAPVIKWCADKPITEENVYERLDEANAHFGYGARWECAAWSDWETKHPIGELLEMMENRKSS